MSFRILSISAATLSLLSPALAAIPAAPDTLRVAPLGRTSHVLRWDDVADETGYTVERQNGASWDWVTTTGGNVTSFIDSGRPDGELPTYRVTATNGEGSSLPSGEVTSVRMNVLFFYADDMGFKDVVANRNPITDGPTLYETPGLDTLVSQGVNFTQAYASGPKCVVARRAMQTGMYDFRPEAIAKGGGIGNEMVTIGEAMKAGGYRTCFIGKWHLGGKLVGSVSGGDEDFSSGGLVPHETPTYQVNDTLDPSDPNYDEANKIPSAQGYDVAIAAGEWGAPPISYFANAPTGVAGEYWYGLPDLYTTDPTEYLTDRLTTEATGFMADAVTNHASEPFFLMLAHYAVHTPLEAKQADIDYFEAKKTAMAAEFAAHPGGELYQYDFSSKVRFHQDQTTYAAMVKSFDESLATLRGYLASTPDPRNPGSMLSETTIIVYSSDHGGKSTHWVNSGDSTDIPTSNYPLRQGKTWCYEGGLRVPLVVYWPGIGEAGATSDSLVNGADFYTTFLDMTGTPRVPSQHLDSMSFARTAVEPDNEPRAESFHWFTNADVGTGNPAMAVYRSGDYKFVYHMIRRVKELYNLAQDISESNDIASIRPDLADEMLHRLIGKRDEVGTVPSKPGTNSWNKELEVVAPVMVIPPLPDGPPSDLAANAVSTTAIDLTWTDGSTNEERFVIEGKIQGGGAFREMATVPANVTRYRVTGLDPDTAYQFRIQAETLAGWNGPSNQLTVSTPASSDDLPIIARGDAVSVLVNETRRFEPLLNDQGEGLYLTAVSSATLGSASVDGDRIEYIPSPGVSGTETLSYTVMDSHGATATGLAVITILNDLTVPEPPVFDLSPVSTALEAWEFDESVGTPFSGLVNSVGTAMMSGDTAQVATDGSGNLLFTVGGAGDNVFRNTTVSSPNVTSGIFELSFTYTSATLAGGDATGANVGFGIRDDSDTDLFLVRIQKQNDTLRLQHRVGTTNTDLENFGVTSLSNLAVRVEFDLDADTFSVFWTPDGEVERSSLAIPMAGTGLELDMIRLLANTNNVDWGASDSVSVDFLRLSGLAYPEPPTPFDYWMAAGDPGLDPAELLPTADADGDQSDNFGEFAFGAAAFDPARGVRALGGLRDTDGDGFGEMVVTLPFRTGASFSGPGPLDASTDEILYQVRGTTDLETFDAPVEEVFPALESGLPPLGAGWRYHSFRLPASNGLTGRGFLQATAVPTAVSP